MKILCFSSVVAFVLLAGLCSPAIAQISTTQAQDAESFEQLEALDKAVLATMRGGFLTNDGVMMNIGVDKASFINGVLQAQSSFRVEDLSLIQKSFGGTVSSGDIHNASGFNTLVQNNLDQKTIQNFTIIDVNVKNIGNLQNGFIESMRNVQNLQLFK